MKRTLLIVGIIVALGVGLGPWAYRTFRDQGELIALPAFDYRTNDSWAALPAQMPPAVWAEGWGVDVILVGPDDSLAPRSQAQIASQTDRAVEQSKRLAESLSVIGPVYAPLYRNANAATDLSAALKTYLDDHNRGRAFVIATDHPLPPEMLAPIRADESLRERFGGFLRLTRARGDAALFSSVAGVENSASDILAYCPPQYTESATCQPVVEIGRQDGMMIVSQDTPIASDNLTGYKEWLEANVAKTAEPLGALEEVEIIDIRRPGETDPMPEAGDD
ncbi:MAG: hypothetical protein V7651_15825 [Hyphomonas oceanitis]|uniref:Uncharacterized protein n=1 Tax=Hyphomonas oceanitis SCH89 TaxID=1280953 RepID=A0A059G5E4_9PROT|nr:hypothetical protein [Hyphomonas oceanitis]KDA02036.1 hypothetical protein HOC_12543 [Hyphomonas oceanitis SCH89]